MTLPVFHKECVTYNIWLGFIPGESASQLDKYCKDTK